MGLTSGSPAVDPCGAVGPGAVASRSPSQRAGAGRAKRRSPTGPAAYGTPRKAATPSATRPRIVPPVVFRISSTRPGPLFVDVVHVRQQRRDGRQVVERVESEALEEELGGAVERAAPDVG